MIGIYFVCYILFPLSFFPFCKRKDQLADVLLNKDETNTVKGLSAVFIVLAHMVIRIEEELQQSFLLLKPITVLGGMGVLLFFFLSGYGLYKGYSNQKIGGAFIKKRFTSIYVPYVFMKLILLVINVIMGYKRFAVSEAGYLFLGDWFIEVIMIQYFIFFISKKVQERFPREKAMIPVCFLLTAILGVWFVFSAKPAGWYNALLLFPFGLLVAKYEEKLIGYIDKACWKYMVLVTACFVVTGGIFAVYKGDMWANVLKRYQELCSF